MYVGGGRERDGEREVGERGPICKCPGRPRIAGAGVTGDGEQPHVSADWILCESITHFNH